MAPMMNSESRKRLDESIARLESGGVRVAVLPGTPDGIKASLIDGSWLIELDTDYLARRDEKRDREAVGRLRALADEWDSFADRDNTGDAVRRAHKRCASDLRAALAEIEPRSTCAACGEPVEPPAALVGDQTFHGWCVP